MTANCIRPARVNPILLHAAERRLSLDGDWRFRLDPDDCGIREGWFRRPAHLTEHIRVPGCWQGQGFGDDGQDRVWDFNLEARVFRATYRGTGWYGHSFTVPPAWQGQQLWLNLGGVHPSAEVWLNSTRLGENVLPFVPFGFNITGGVRSDCPNELMVRVHEQHRDFGFAFNWQGNWSGLYRGVDLVATGLVWFEHCLVLPEVDSEALRVRVTRGSAAEDSVPCSVLVQVTPVDGTQPPVDAEFVLAAASGEFRLPLPGARLWTPDSPHLYRVDLTLVQDGQVCDARSERVGFVKLEARGRQFCIGGEPYYLRGSGDFLSCPETGCPDTDRDRWRRKLQTLRDYGYNYVRCQSYVYGPEYYDVADEVGILVQSEMGMLGAWGGTSPWHGYQWPKPTPDNAPTLQQQWDLVVERDACHPSANLYCMSNEYGSGTDFPRAAWQCYHSTRALKPSAFVIWTDGGYSPDLPGDFINHDVKAFQSVELAALDKPLIQHEYQWWSSFPDVRLQSRYTGAVRPYAADIAAQTAAKRGQAHLLETYAHHSQRLQFIETKAKMEAMRRDHPELAGINHFNAMDTNPSPQGILNEFYERKLTDAATWRQTNGDTVVLCSLGFDDRCWAGGQSVSVRWSVSDYAHPPFRAPRLTWRLHAGAEALAAGAAEFQHVPFTTVPAGEITITVPAGEITITVPPVNAPVAAVLEATLTDSDGSRESCNSWQVWLFPESELPAGVSLSGKVKWTWLRHWTGRVPSATRTQSTDSASGQLRLAEQLGEELVAFMHRGGRVLLAAGEGLVRPHSPLFGYVKYFFTPPANYSPYEDGQNGTVIAAHPAFDGLPHEGFADWQFFRMMENSPPLDLDPLGLSEGEPIIRVIHRYPTLHPLAYLVERRVGAGALLLCALELNSEWVEARWLLAQFCLYAMSDACRPDLELAPETLERLLGGTMKAEG